MNGPKSGENIGLSHCTSEMLPFCRKTAGESMLRRNFPKSMKDYPSPDGPAHYVMEPGRREPVRVLEAERLERRPGLIGVALGESVGKWTQSVSILL